MLHWTLDGRRDETKKRLFSPKWESCFGLELSDEIRVTNAARPVCCNRDYYHQNRTDRVICSS